MAKEREDAAFKKTPLGKMQAIHDNIQKLDKKKKLRRQLALDTRKALSAADAAAVKDRLEQEAAGGVRRGRAKANAKKPVKSKKKPAAKKSVKKTTTSPKKP